MKYFGLLVPILLICACATFKNSSHDLSFNTVKAESRKQWELKKDTEEYQNFINDWLKFNNSNAIDEKGNCYRFSKDTEVLILIQNSAGVIEYVVPENENEKTRCFRNAFLGKKYPKPPYAPFYHYMIMQG